MKRFNKWLDRYMMVIAVGMTVFNALAVLNDYHQGYWYFSAATLTSSAVMWYFLGKARAYREIRIDNEKFYKELNESRKEFDDKVRALLFPDQENEIMGQVEDILGPQNKNDQDKP